MCAAERARARADPGGRTKPGCSPGGQCHKKERGRLSPPPSLVPRTVDFGDPFDAVVLLDHPVYIIWDLDDC